ncbi:SprB repeat-containing protein [Riemerella anatipestifer]|uniref:SprB repeat-containing protein n=3 Tax=Riemerella anatipestifer TaxID=34085 RepID=A0AAP3AS13_RIEAN|nr:SprB repeat-containing protein [Riemerella anatipestifer]AZZ58722.1 hypothetical protein AWB57_06575 [Riemerella anatipestifer]MBT0573470.1 SprB repeat-containing protein [Riemerella anatipestifer]MCO7319170.1 SprB repeat-containing protein [Riemerella anatipestifer]MCQ4155440.1 SprB repeat-containing protein [Riemerella anatipestifer]MCQ4181388.1 SprB repeat-containing protein [Riemerella anatipestifer]
MHKNYAHYDKKTTKFDFGHTPFAFLAQLQSFTISLTGTPEICTNNGTLSWTTSGTTANSSIVYSIYKTSDLSKAIETTSLLTFTGLPAGTYRVVATQTLSGTTQSNQATSNDFTIADQKTPITNVSSQVVSNETCGNDGSFRVTVTGGRSPYRYQILDDSNVVVSEFQDDANTYTFTGLKAGNHRYRVIDDCGTGFVRGREIQNQVSNFTEIVFKGTPTQDCEGVQLTYEGTRYYYARHIKLPLSIKMEYTNPNTGAIETVSGTDTNMPIIPYFKGVSQLQLKTTTTDACGRKVTQYNDFKYSASYNAFIGNTSGVCPGQYFSTYAVDTWQANYTLVSKYRVNFISAPQGFDPLVYNSNHGQLRTVHRYGSYSQALPEGTYKYQIIDECGNIQQENTLVITQPLFQLQVGQVGSCSSSAVTLSGYAKKSSSLETFPLINTRITSAPQAFIDQYEPLPYIIPDDAFVTQDGHKDAFLLIDIPPGAYTFSSETTCNSSVSTFDINASVNQQVDPTTRIEFNCAGQFKFIRDSGSGSIVDYQKFFPEKNAWGTSPMDAVPSYVGTFRSHPNEWNTQSAGKYRIISTPRFYREIVDNKIVARVCDPIVLKEFEIGATLTFSNAYAFACANGTYDVALSASGGTAPLTYAIVSSEANDATTIKDNGTNPIFEGLAGGTYFFRVYDQCGNFQTRKLDIAKLGRPGIRMVPVCASNELSLVVDGLDYLNYEWTKEGEPNNILSTTNVLNLGTYTADKAGIYHIRLSTNSATSCINTTLDLKLTEDALTAAKAGTGQTVNLTYDENMGTNLNLFDYLQGNYDGFGTWTETTTPSSSLLIGNQWRVSSAQSGTYSFKYTVTGACGGVTDTATVIINLAKVCYKKPVISAAGDALPTKVGITSLSRAGADAQGENWPMVREGGWIALESNTKGFVVNRVPFDTNGLPVGIPVANFVAGMMVYDTTNNCLKIYNGSIWSCFSTQTCPE